MSFHAAAIAFHIGAFFVNSEFLDELKYQACLIELRWTDVETIIHGAAKVRKTLQTSKIV